jgi:hypothetical protein
MDRGRISTTVKALKKQYDQLCRAVNKANPHFWDALTDEGAERGPPPFYSPGSAEEAQLAVLYCAKAWEESEDAMVMIEADTCSFVPVYKPSPAAATAGSAQSRGSGNRRIVALCLENEDMFDSVHGELISQINSKAKMERATTPSAAIWLLSQQPPPAVILVADAGITRHRKVWESVMDRLHGGATVVLAGCFSSMVTMGQFDRFFARLGLRWRRGSYQRQTVNLHREVVGAQLASQLPPAYSQKALFVSGVEKSAVWYSAEENSSEAAVVFEKVGAGKLGYVGDVNGEEGSNAVVLAMCGLLS